jgi:hypothetical protein
MMASSAAERVGRRPAVRGMKASCPDSRGSHCRGGLLPVLGSPGRREDRFWDEGRSAAVVQRRGEERERTGGSGRSERRVPLVMELPPSHSPFSIPTSTVGTGTASSPPSESLSSALRRGEVGLRCGLVGLGGVEIAERRHGEDSGCEGGGDLHREMGCRPGLGMVTGLRGYNKKPVISSQCCQHISS